MRHVVIIGAGHAGSQCAISLRDAGFEGSISLVCDDPALPYQKPPLSKTFLKSPDQAPMPLRAAAAYDQARIDCRFGVTVLSLDPVARTVSLSDGSALVYTELVLATGARNRTLPDLSPGLANVHSLRTLGDALKLRTNLPDLSSVVIIGGGFIGLETAACLSAMGKKVTVIEGAERILGRVVSPAISTFVSDHLLGLGISIRTSASVRSVEVAGNLATEVHLADGTSLPCDGLLVGIGAVPNVELASGAGMECDNGIVVDRNFQTSKPGIYAIGDCARFHHWQTETMQRLESVQNATDQARALARHLVKSEPVTYRAVPWFWSDIGSLKLQIAGLSMGTTNEIVRQEQGKITVTRLKGDQLVAVETINSAADHMIARSLLEKEKFPPLDVIRAGTAAMKQFLQSE